jgi:hypothetical protein
MMTLADNFLQPNLCAPCTLRPVIMAPFDAVRCLLKKSDLLNTRLKVDLASLAQLLVLSLVEALTCRLAVLEDRLDRLSTPVHDVG